MSLLNQMHAAWQAEIAHTHDKPKDMILTNWHLGAADGWYRAIEMVRSAIGPEPERSGYYECLSDKPSGTWDEAFKPEPTDDLAEAVAAEMWRVYEASPIAREGSKGISWVRLKDLAASHPDKAPAVIRQVGLDEARAAIEIVRRYDAIATPERARSTVTREAVAAIVTGAQMCQRRDGSCGPATDCYCRRTIDAIMALIGGAP